LGHGTINVNGDLWHTWTPTHTTTLSTHTIAST
jgi:hypothetical protein